MASTTQRNKYDPLEAAKLGTDAPRAAQSAAPSPAEPAVAADATGAAGAATSAADLGDLPPPRPKFRVTQSQRVTIRGNVCDFKVGRIIDSAGYDIAALRTQGLQLEPLEG